ncbi:hypothetical protein DFJ58DRAFT_728854 [Suillus subalutaceus]|uniref:uncharacterized protein n=1 Tax=Suillus subalutaceus TaxID=48586 RepID=UPI001B87B384|nr:uncharacterized protein DFJ58DRAFT_728854 [Suillus subalutaceus]KAG1851635.1 hypothetical protein DFJ58DRAFT_728854 [Suillus subalutaceus]
MSYPRCLPSFLQNPPSPLENGMRPGHTFSNYLQTMPLLRFMSNGHVTTRTYVNTPILKNTGWPSWPLIWPNGLHILQIRNLSMKLSTIASLRALKLVSLEKHASKRSAKQFQSFTITNLTPMTSAHTNLPLLTSPFGAPQSQKGTVFPPSASVVENLGHTFPNCTTSATLSGSTPTLEGHQEADHLLWPPQTPNTVSTSTFTAMESEPAPDTLTEEVKSTHAPYVDPKTTVLAAESVWTTDPDSIPYSTWDTVYAFHSLFRSEKDPIDCDANSICSTISDSGSCM